jgi:hypothetical protein
MRSFPIPALVAVAALAPTVGVAALAASIRSEPWRAAVLVGLLLAVPLAGSLTFGLISRPRWRPSLPGSAQCRRVGPAVRSPQFARGRARPPTRRAVAAPISP